MSVWLGFLIAIIAYAMLNIGNVSSKEGPVNSRQSKILRAKTT